MDRAVTKLWLVLPFSGPIRAVGSGVKLENTLNTPWAALESGYGTYILPLVLLDP